MVILPTHLDSTEVYPEKAIIRTRLSKQISDARKKMGLSQIQFAEKIGITQAQLSRLETNDNIRPAKKTLKALAPYIGSSYRELLGRCGYSFNAIAEFEDISDDEKSILKEISSLDTELLKCFKGISFYGCEPKSEEFLKNILTIMKKSAYRELNEKEEQGLEALKYILQTIV